MRVTANNIIEYIFPTKGIVVNLNVKSETGAVVSFIIEKQEWFQVQNNRTYFGKKALPLNFLATKICKLTSAATFFLEYDIYEEPEAMTYIRNCNYINSDDDLFDIQLSSNPPVLKSKGNLLAPTTSGTAAGLITAQNISF